MKRHFAYKHPTFGTVKNPKTASHLRQSVYYWWYEYLKRNEDYRKTCENTGKGKCAKLYKDFGDIYSVEFPSWWKAEERGARLFAEPPTSSIRVIDGDAVVLREHEGQSLVLEVPLNLPINHLVNRFRDIISKHHQGKKGHRHNAVSHAIYVVRGKVDIAFLETALMVLDERQEHPKKPLWRIANELRIGSKENLLNSTDSPKAAEDKRNILAATASRYVKKAREMVTNVGKGIFPLATKISKPSTSG